MGTPTSSRRDGAGKAKVCVMGPSLGLLPLRKRKALLGWGRIGTRLFRFGTSKSLLRTDRGSNIDGSRKVCSRLLRALSRCTSTTRTTRDPQVVAIMGRPRRAGCVVQVASTLYVSLTSCSPHLSLLNAQKRAYSPPDGLSTASPHTTTLPGPQHLRLPHLTPHRRMEE